MNCASILGTGSYLPKKVVDNVELYSLITGFDIGRSRESFQKRHEDVSALSDAQVFDKWVRQVCGVEQRHFLTELDTKPMIGQAKYTDKKNLELMGYFASLEAIKDAKIDPSEIDGVIVATMTSDTLCPNSAVTLADMLGLGEVGTIVNNTACSGFLDALGDAYAKVLTGIHKNVLVVAADQLQTRMDWADPTTAILFGDGAGAAIIGRTEKPGIKSFWAGSNYSENITMAYGDKLVMGGGPLVLKKAVNAMHHTAVMAMERAGKMMDEIAFVLPHQANLRILQELARKFGIEEKRMLISVQKIANISAATVPVTLDQYRRGQLAGCPYKPGALLVATSVGGGYSFAGSVFEA